VRIITLISLVLVAGAAHADNAADATKAFEEGLALQKEGKYADACARFTKSYELDKQASRPAPGTQLNLGECAEREGQLRKAYVLFDDAAQEYNRRAKAAEAALAKDPNSAELKRDLDRANAGQRLARERADALGPKLAKVVVRIVDPSVAGMSVRIGDRSVSPSAEVIEYLDSGNVTITVSAPERQPFTTSAKAEAGKQVVVEVPALATGGGGGGGEPVAPGPRRQRKRVLLAAGLGGGGVMLLGISVIVALNASSQYNDAEANCTSGAGGLICPNPADAAAIDDAFGKADIATVLGIGGLALAATGAVLYVTAPKEGVAITPMASATTAGLSIRGHF
jgi:tetratricopeptide (TPR) repeat protein